MRTTGALRPLQGAKASEMDPPPQFTALPTAADEKSAPASPAPLAPTLGDPIDPFLRVSKNLDTLASSWLIRSARLRTRAFRPF